MTKLCRWHGDLTHEAGDTVMSKNLTTTLIVIGCVVMATIMPQKMYQSVGIYCVAAREILLLLTAVFCIVERFAWSGNFIFSARVHKEKVESINAD